MDCTDTRAHISVHVQQVHAAMDLCGCVYLCVYCVYVNTHACVFMDNEKTSDVHLYVHTYVFEVARVHKAFFLHECKCYASLTKQNATCATRIVV
jgi:hypothetical protein